MTKITNAFLPLYDERPCRRINMLVIHCSACNAADMLEIMKKRRVSSHYIIESSGRIYRPVPEAKRAWHAGVSRWRGVDNINHYSVGIELESLSMGQEPYPEAQINSLAVLARQIISRYQIPAYNVAGHSDVAPVRKPDPGIAFPWRHLAEKGIGLWYDIKDAEKVTESDPAKLLAAIGYDTSDLAAASYAFCRHFVPSEVKILPGEKEIVENVYPEDFVLPGRCLPVLKACAYAYTKAGVRRR